jgi:hypothetical protein
MAADYTAIGPGSKRPPTSPRTGNSRRRSASRAAPERARQIAEELELRFAQDAELPGALNDVHECLQRFSGPTHDFGADYIPTA